MEAKIALGAPQDAEKWSQNFSGGPPAKTSEFVFGPGALQERSGVDFYSVLAAPWGPGGAQGVPGGLRELILDPGEAHFGGSGGRILSPPGAHFRSTGAAENQAPKERTCKTCNALKLKTVLENCLSPVFTPSHLLSLASTALCTMPLASSSLLLAALSVPVLAQVTESALAQLEVR